MPKWLKIIVAVGFGAVVVVGAGFWWFILRDDAPPEASLPARTTVGGDVSTSAGGGGAPGTLAGAWTVKQGKDVFAGYRMQEKFGGDTIEKTAVGRSPAVTGTLTAIDTAITAVSVTVDTTKLASDERRRDARIRDDGLETDRFPRATFVLTTPIDLGGAPAAGAIKTVQATGDLTLHGVTKGVTFTLETRWSGDLIDVAGKAPIVLADYSISPPNVGGFVSVADQGLIELQLTFTRG